MLPLGLGFTQIRPFEPARSPFFDDLYSFETMWLPDEEPAYEELQSSQPTQHKPPVRRPNTFGDVFIAMGWQAFLEVWEEDSPRTLYLFKLGGELDAEGHHTAGDIARFAALLLWLGKADKRRDN